METAIYKDILIIYRTTTPLTKLYYNLRHFIQVNNKENWVIRW